jgi:uncharacterized protein (TIGR02453 family)
VPPKTSQQPFASFPQGTTDFLRGLAEHNEKPWFDLHRADYEAFYVQPAVSFVEALGPRLQNEVSSLVQFEARINGSLFRINRDIRFSKDKTPYKTHLDLWFWEGGRKGWESTGLFLRLTPDSLSLGAGMHHLMPEQLAAYRNAVLDPVRGPSLVKLTEHVESAGLEVGASVSRKTVPRGLDSAHERARFLRYEGLVAMWNGEPPAEIRSQAFVDWCLARFKDASPINDWLREALGV